MITPKLRILPLAGCFLALAAEAQIETNLIGYWEFENNLTETSGAHTGGLHDGLESGTVAYVANTDTDFGQALDLDGSNGVYVQNSANTEGAYAGTFDADINTANAISISFWANGVPANWSPFISKHGEGSQGYQVRRRTGEANATFTLRDTGGDDDPFASNGAATASGWRHFLAVWDGASGTRKLYVDGVEDTTMTIASGDTSNTGPGNAVDKFLAFGMRDAGAAAFGNNFTGQIDDVAIWSRPLTDLEAIYLARNPVSDVIGETDADMDGLLAFEETALGTNPNLADTDGDGVSDLDEAQVGSDPLNDNDFDADGLSNLEETSGSENSAFSNETTDWNNDDSDEDGILDGEEVKAGVDGFVTNPNDSDTDNDGWLDATEIGATPQSDPTSSLSVPPVTTNLIGYWEFENNLTETSGAHAAGLHDGIAVDLTDTAVTPAYIVNPTTNFGQALDLNNGNAAGVSYGVKVANSRNDETSYASTFDADVNTANAMSISFWSNGTLGRWGPILSKFGEDDDTNGTGGWQVRRQNNNPGLTLTLRNTDGVDDPASSNSSATTGGWKHVVVIWDGSGSGTRKIYIDGVEEVLVTGDKSAGGPGDAIDKFLTFGMRDNGIGGLSNLFGGDIDDVAIWTRVLLPNEISLLSFNPLSQVITNTDTDGDGLFDDDETTIYMTDPAKPDTDDDGVNDLDEVTAGSDPLNDNDFDMDGLTNLQETSGSANTAFSNETTVWNDPDSDLDGVNDGDEVSNANGYVTNPNDPDTDDDGYTDGIELNAVPVSDPTDDQVILLTEWERGLTGYWKFDNDLTDSGHLGADGTMAGSELTPTYVAGQFGQAIDLDKSNSQRVVITGDENYFDTVGSSMTVSIWVTAEAFNDQWQGIFAKGELSWRVARRSFSDGAAFAAGTNGDAPALDETANTAPINDSNWHHIVGVAEFGVATRIYVDGYLVEERTNALPNVVDVDNPVWIGGNPDTIKSWNGNIDDAAIWKRALTAEEVYTIFSNGNDVEYLIDNDVAPVTVIPEPNPPVIIVESYGFDESANFEVEVSGLDPNKTYELKVTESLAPGEIDWVTVGFSPNGATTHTFSEPNPLQFAPTGFYALFEVVEE